MANPNIGPFLDAKINECGYTLRETARLAGVSPSTLSRVIRGKRRPSARLLRTLAPVLGCPLPTLLAKAGINSPEPESEPIDQATGLLLDRLLLELPKYRAFGDTKEGQRLIKQELDAYITKSRQVLPDLGRIEELKCLWHDYQWATPYLSWISGALLYFISPCDLIPDFLGAIGYIDDVLIINWVWEKVHNRIEQQDQEYPPEIKSPVSHA
ncbi:MAG: DUF1232 domain-containing protein [Heliobacteriaceae bacterium]|nr:DUF1232 domain-containing protein [Heliobacteriaceae bacterium]MDD4588012.1 DUF1232 domain-containing protein [Heliobacteriaceae bacterium]